LVAKIDGVAVRGVSWRPGTGGVLAVDALAVANPGGDAAPQLLQVQVRVPMPDPSRSPFGGIVVPPS
jgi:hypothetical protein